MVSLLLAGIVRPVGAVKLMLEAPGDGVAEIVREIVPWRVAPDVDE